MNTVGGPLFHAKLRALPPQADQQEGSGPPQKVALCGVPARRAQAPSAVMGSPTVGEQRQPRLLPEKVPGHEHWVPPQAEAPAEGAVPIQGG